MELQQLLLSEKSLPVLYLLLQAQDETVGVDGICVTLTIRILHKDLDLRGDGLQQIDGDVREDSEIGQGAAAAEELPLTTRYLEGQTLQTHVAAALSNLLFNLLYRLIRVYPEDQIWVTPLLHCHLDVSCPL